MTEKPETPKTAETAPIAPAAAKPAAKRKKAKKSKKRSRKKPAAKGGRPQWKPSLEERTAVEQMKFCGESEATIARSLNVDVATLRKHCEVELADGYANRRRQVTKMLFDAAQEGNVTAIKRLDEMGKISGAAEAMRNRGGAAPTAAAPVKEPKAEKVGKKEERKNTAAMVEGKFAPPPPPKLVVSNK